MCVWSLISKSGARRLTAKICRMLFLPSSMYERRIDTESELWPILHVGDGATGTTVLSDLYQRWKDSPVNVNLDQLWANWVSDMEHVESNLIRMRLLLTGSLSRQGRPTHGNRRNSMRG